MSPACRSGRAEAERQAFADGPRQGGPIAPNQRRLGRHLARCRLRAAHPARPGRLRLPPRLPDLRLRGQAARCAGCQQASWGLPGAAAWCALRAPAAGACGAMRSRSLRPGRPGVQRVVATGSRASFLWLCADSCPKSCPRVLPGIGPTVSRTPRLTGKVAGKTAFHRGVVPPRGGGRRRKREPAIDKASRLANRDRPSGYGNRHAKRDRPVAGTGKWPRQLSRQGRPPLWSRASAHLVNVMTAARALSLTGQGGKHAPICARYFRRDY